MVASNDTKLRQRDWAERSLPKLRLKVNGEGVCCCELPGHKDSTPSLLVNLNSGQCTCRRCNVSMSLAEYGEATGKTPYPTTSRGVSPDNRSRWVYQDQSGQPVLRVTRYERVGKKAFFQEIPDGRGGWAKGGLGAKKRPLYNAPALAAAPLGSLVFIVEGEKAAEWLIQRGILATTAPEGAGKFHNVDPEYLDLLVSLGPIVLPDNDDPGVQHAIQAAEVLDRACGVTAKILELPGLPPKGDIVDWLVAPRTNRHLLDLVPKACSLASFRGSGQEVQIELLGDPGPCEWPAGLLVDSEEPEAEALEEEPKEATWPAPMEPEALHGIIGEITRTVEPHTESDPAAILVQALVMAGHLIGRGPFFPVERTKHGCNENVVIVGNSSKARKGTSWSNVREIGKAALGAGPKGLQIINGLGSGEALVSAVQDRPEDDGAATGEVSDRKRLLIMEQEYAHVLKVGAREGSTLSPTLRAAWDGEPISNLTKGSRLTSTGHHLSFIGHITGRELRETLPAVEAANGNANRNIFIAAKRSKFLPEGGSLTDEDVKALGDKLRQRLEWVKSIGKAPVVRDPAARWLWAQIYRSLSEGLPGLAGSILGRAEAHVTRISLLYALLDSSSVIRLEHLLAALAVWDYSVASVLYVFGSKLEVGLSDSILSQLRATPNGMTRTELSKFLQGNKSSGEIGRALSFLEDQGLAEKVKEKSPNPLCKKPVERWKALKAQGFAIGTGYLGQAKVALESLPSELRIYGFNEFTEVPNLLGEKLL